MNYISQIKAFHELVQDKSLSTGQIALWYALMYINNRCAWTEWFTVSARSLELNTGLSRQAIAKNRNVLKQLELIDFKPNGVKATSYKVEELSNSLQDSLQPSCQDGLQDSLQDSCQNSRALNKPNVNQTKPNNKKRVTNVTPEKDPFKEYAGEDTELLAALEDYAAMRKELKAPLTKRAKELAVGQLDKLTASRNERIQILQQSVMNGWKGLFALEGKRQGYKPMTVTSEGEISPELQALEALIVSGRNVT